MNKNTLFLSITLLCCWSAALGQNPAPTIPPTAQVDQADEPPAKPEKQPPAIASDSIIRLMQLRQDAAEVAQEILDYQRAGAPLQKRGQTLQARIVGAEREALEKAGIDPDKYALDDSFKPVKRQAQPQAQRGSGRANRTESGKAPEAKPEPTKPERRSTTAHQHLTEFSWIQGPKQVSPRAQTVT